MPERGMAEAAEERGFMVSRCQSVKVSCRGTAPGPIWASHVCKAVPPRIHSNISLPKHSGMWKSSRSTGDQAAQCGWEVRSPHL